MNDLVRYDPLEHGQLAGGLKKYRGFTQKDARAAADDTALTRGFKNSACSVRMAWNAFTRDTEELSQLKAEDMDYRKIHEGHKSQTRRELGVAWHKGEGVGAVDKATMRLGGGILNMGRKAAEKAVLKKMGVAAAKGMPEFAALAAKESVKGGLGGAARHAAALHELRGVVAQWNRKHSKRAIKSENIMAGVRNRQRRVAGAKDGIYLPDKHSDARTDGGFAFGH